MMINLMPAAFFLLAALACLIQRSRRMGASIFLIASVGALLCVLELPDGNLISYRFLDFTLQPLLVDKLSRVFGVIFALIAGLAGLYGYNTFHRGEQVAASLYAAGALTVTFAGDYLTLYLGWELMALASYYLIVARQTSASYEAGARYLFVHITGGILLLGGILLNYMETASFQVHTITTDAVSFGSVLILLGVAINTAVVPLHAWLPDAYPRATIVGAVFLSALTTKTAVYLLARVFPGWEILLIFGVLMTVYGVVFAFLADDIRRVLAYHIVSQVGFMVAGIGIGTEMAINGAVAHAFCHILYKALLFMACGAVLYATGKSRLSELGGLYKKLPWLLFFYMIGAVSISGFPLFNGYVSKSMTIAAAHQAHENAAYYFMYLASVGTFLSVGLKLPYFAWFGKEQSISTERVGITMSMGMIVTAALCFLLGVYPQPLYAALPFAVAYNPFTLEHLLHTLGYLGGTGLAFFLFLKWLKMKRTDLIDTDWFYRAPARGAAFIFTEMPGRFFDLCENLAMQSAGVLKSFVFRPYDPNQKRSPLAWTASAILVVFVVLSLWLVAG